jgi:Anti-CRISPR protein AcrIC5
MQARMTIVSYNGQEIEFDDAVAQMDPALREIVEAELGERSEQELLDAYAAAHLAVYGEDFYAP